MSATTVSRRNSCSVTVRSDSEKAELLKTFDPSLQVMCGGHPVNSIMCAIPTLARVRAEYGEQTALDWLRLELNDYQNFVSVKGENELSDDVIKVTATLILQEYHYLKLSEVMLFFYRLKAGCYGELYGRINPQNLMCRLREFDDWRRDVLYKEQKRRDDIEREAARANAVSRDEYLRMKQRNSERNTYDTAGI